MKTNILIVLIILIGLAAVAVFVYRNFPGPEAGQEETPLTIETGEEKIEEEPEVKEEEEVFEETLLAKDDFEITLLPGWQEISNIQEALLLAVDIREEITDEKLKNVGFRTYFSIESDDLTKYEKEYSLQEYVEEVKISLIQAIENVEFTKEKEGIINGNNAIFVECESTQEEIDYKTLLVFVEKENNIWAISFNTIPGSWLSYRDLFYQTAKSFKLK